LSPATGEVKAKVQLHPSQQAFRRSDALFRAFVGGRGAGKSWCGAYDLIRRARPNHTYLIGSPTGVLMGDTTYPTFKKLAQELGIWGGVKLTPYPNATLLLEGGDAVVRFRTAEDPERMRGPNLSGAWLDEASIMHEDAYKIVIACLREGGRMGWLSSTFTPKGPTHWTYEVFATGRPNTALFHAATHDNPFLPDEFEGVIRAQYGDTPYAEQELGGRFVQIEGAVFPAQWFNDIMIPEWPEGVIRTAMYLDPSQGKDSKSHDSQAFVRAGFWPGPANENRLILDCVAVKEPVPAMVARGVRLYRDWWPDLWVFEENGTLSLLATEIDRQCREAVIPAKIMGITNTDPKQWRIRTAFMSYLSRGQIRIVDSPGGRLLKAQLMDAPLAVHDDCSDAAAGAITAVTQMVKAGL
jgi:phage terminase large subunit-like protein